MQIVFSPYADQTNPYQRMLAAALVPLGVKISPPGKRPLLSLLGKGAHGKLDLVHFHWVAPYLLAEGKGKSLIKSSIFLLACMALRAEGVKLVWTVHNLVGHESSRPGLELFARRILWRACQGVIVHCPAAIDLLVQAYRLPPALHKKVEVIPHGHFIHDYPNQIPRREARKKLGLEQRRGIWLYFGLIRPYKNVAALIENFSQMGGAESLLIAGNPQNEEIKMEIKRHVISDERILTRLEFIPDDQIQIFMNAADLVVLPFKQILTSSSVVLAASFAKTVVTPAVGCSPFILVKQPGQLLYQPHKVNALQEALRSSREMDIEKIGQDNLEVARSYPWSLSAKKTFDLYQRCLGDR